MHPILTATVGSVAYGLNTASSDVDTMVIFAHPTEELGGLYKLVDSKKTDDPDIIRHEAGKYCQLAIKCNPSVLEILWLPAVHLQAWSPDAVSLIRIRNAFLSAKKVRSSYLGYASSQFEGLKKRGDGKFSSDTGKRTAKHARHLFRLLNQGKELYLTGDVTVEVDDPEMYHTFGERVAAGNTLWAEKVLADVEEVFNNNKSVLPEEPDEDTVADWIRTVRRHYLDRRPDTR